MLQVKRGIIFKNKTLAYLSPILNSFGPEFINEFSSVKQGILAMSIQDYLFNDAKGIDSTESVLFIVFDRYGAFNDKKGHYFNMDLGNKNLKKFLEFFRKHPAYMHDYVFDSVKRGGQHCVAIYLGERWSKAYNAFTQSRFSEMYTKEELIKCGQFPEVNNVRNSIYEVLTKNEKYLEFFKKKLIATYNLKTDFDFGNTPFQEYELPVVMEDESFNYRKLMV